MGTSPIDYPLRRRIAHACELMRDASLDLTQVALEAGVSDGNCFSRQFKRLMGTPPARYRLGA